MGQDALDHVGGKPKFSKKDKIAFAKAKREEEIAKELKDPKVVKKTSKAFKEKIKKDLERNGIKAPEEAPAAPEKPLPTWIDTKRFDTVEVKVDLSTDEKNAAGQELAHKKKQKEQIEKDKKDHMAQYKAQLDEVEAQMSDLSNKVTLGYEYRKFSCQLYLDFTTKQRVYKDRETGMERKRETLKADDYQMRLPV